MPDLFAASASRRLRIKTGAAVIAWAGAIAFAAPAAADLDMAALQADAQDILDSYVARSDGALKPAGGVNAIRDGDTVVLTVPALAFEPGGSRIDVPEIVLRLDEVGEDRVAFDLRLPSEIVGVKLPPAAPDTLTITIGGQSITGIFRPSVQTTETLRMELTQILAMTGDGGIEIGAIRGDANAAATSPEKWKGDGAFSLEDLNVFGRNRSPMLSIGKIEQQLEIGNFGLPAYVAIMRRMTGGSLLKQPDPDSLQVQEASAEFVQKLPEIMDQASGSMLLRMVGLSVTMPGAPPFDLASAAFQLGAAPEDGHYAVDIGLLVEDPHIDPAASPVPPHLLPSLLNAEASLRRLPFATLWAMISEPLQQEIKGDPSGKSAGELEMAPMAAMGVAAEAGSFAELRDLEFQVGPARLTARGVGPLVPGLPEPQLRIEALIEGLEELVQEIEQLPPELSQQAMPIVLMLRGLGEAQARNDQIVHAYLIEQGPNGPTDIRINGIALDQIGPPQ